MKMSDADVAEVLHCRPGELHASDALIVQAGVAHGTFERMKRQALYVKDGARGEGGDEWAEVEVRYVWCDMSVWEMPWGARVVSEELEAAREAGTDVRNVQFVRFRGANHFVSLVCGVLARGVLV